MTRHVRVQRAAIPVSVAAVALGAFALRLVQLGVDSLWYDETVSVYLAGQPVAELIAHTARDIHPPGYYLLLRAWLMSAGFPTGHADAAGYRLEFMAGFLSLCLGVLLVPLTWQLARRLRLGDTVAALAALLVAVSPFGVWYSQEVRMYTLGACLAVVCLLATVPFLLGGCLAAQVGTCLDSLRIGGCRGPVYPLLFRVSPRQCQPAGADRACDTLAQRQAGSNRLVHQRQHLKRRYFTIRKQQEPSLDFGWLLR